MTIVPPWPSLTIWRAASRAQSMTPREVDVDDFLPELRGSVEAGPCLHRVEEGVGVIVALEVVGVRDAGGRDDRVELAEPAGRFGHGIDDVLLAGGIGVDEEGFSAQVLNLGSGLLAALVVDIGDGDGSALASEHEGGRPAHAGTAAGNDGNPAFELSCHESLLPRSGAMGLERLSLDRVGAAVDAKGLAGDVSWSGRW